MFAWQAFVKTLLKLGTSQTMPSKYDYATGPTRRALHCGVCFGNTIRIIYASVTDVLATGLTCYKTPNLVH
jgi:hypothetical protein